MKRTAPLVGAILVLALVLPIAGGAGAATRAVAARHRTYYVATNGNDAHVGSRAHPFRTIQRGLNRAHAGDTVVVRPGHYKPARFARGGAKGAPIILKALHRVYLQGNGSGTGLVASRVSHVVIQGFHVVNFDVGIAVDDARAVVVRRNVARGNDDTGIQTTGSRHVLVTRNRLLDFGIHGKLAADQDYGVNFYFSTHVAARRNFFFGRHNQALSFKRRVVHGSAKGNTFKGCLLTCLYIGQNDDDSEGDMTSARIIVTGNRFRATRRGGIHYLLRTPITVRNVRYALVQHNVFDPSCELHVYYTHSPQHAGRKAGHNRVRHNVVKRWGR